MSLVRHLTTPNGLSRSEESSGQFIARQPHIGGDKINRMGADRKGNRQRLAPGGTAQINFTQIAGCDQIDAGFLASAQHQPTAPDVGQTGFGIDRA